MMSDYIEVGTVLVAVNPCTMHDGSGDALTVDKEYVVEHVNDNRDALIIVDDEGAPHMFDMMTDETSNPDPDAHWAIFFRIGE